MHLNAHYSYVYQPKTHPCSEETPWHDEVEDMLCSVVKEGRSKIAKHSALVTGKVIFDQKLADARVKFDATAVRHLDAPSP